MLLKILTRILRKKLQLNPHHCAHRIHIFYNWGGRTNLIFLLYSSPLRPILRWAAISVLRASCGYLNHISTFQCLDFMFVWVLLYLSSSGADFSWFWLLVSMRKSNGLCFCLSQSPKKKAIRQWVELGFISSFATIFLSFEKICVDELGSAIWWPAGESEDKPLMAADKSLPASCTERNLLWKKGWSWYRAARLGKKRLCRRF